VILYHTLKVMTVIITYEPCGWWYHYL
jgi:hypothetical protein